MASSFPGGLDNFTNPTASDTLDSATVPHATQHANVNDAVEAIESTLGVNPQGASATVVARLGALDTTVAGKAGLSLSNIFTVGAQAIRTGADAVKGLIIQRFSATQSANLLSILQSDGTTEIARIRPGGQLGVGSQIGGTALAVNMDLLGSQVGMIVQGFPAQTANLTQYQNSTPSVLGGRNAVGQIWSGSTAPVTYVVGTTTISATGNGTTATLTTDVATQLSVGDLISVDTIQPAGYQTTGSIVTAVSNTSPFTVSYANTTTAAQTVAGFVRTQSQGSFVARSAATKGLVVRANASQTANLQEWQNSGGTSLAKVDSSGAVTASGATFTGTVTVPTPVNATDAATKSYADSVAAGLNIHGSVSAASTANIAGTYANGTSGADGGLGVGATFTVTATGVFILDTNTIALNERVLLKNQTTQTQNGIYVCTTAGAVGVQAVFTRATDANNSIAGQVVPGDFVFVATGSQASTAWVQSTVGTSTNPVDGIKIGTDNITFTQFSAGSSYTNGSGIGSLSGGVIAVDSTVARTNSTNTFTGTQTVNGAVSLNGGNLFVQGPSAPQYLSYDAMTGDLDLTSGSLNTTGNVGGGTGVFTNVNATQLRVITDLGLSQYARFQGTFTALRTITVPDASITIAGAGANSDITSLSGLTTALSTAQGGTGSTTATGSGSNVLATNPVITKPTITRAVYQNVAPATLTWTANVSTIASGVLTAGWMRITSANLTATGTLNLPSTTICAGFLTTNGEATDVIVVNEASFAATATGVSGVTLLGNTSIAANSSAIFRFYRTSATVFVWVRIA